MNKVIDVFNSPITNGMQEHNCNIVNLGTVKPEPIQWLWPGRIPLGMFVLLAGQPGVGKTTISHSIAAIQTIGSRWPFSEHRADRGSVVILTAEDDPKYTLVPRLMAAGADLDRINLIKSVIKPHGDKVLDLPLLLSEDMHELDRMLQSEPDTKLLIMDPLSAYMGVKDSHRDADVRQVLGPLTDLAAKHGVTVMGITHLSKNTSNSAMARFMGSTGIIAAARAAFLVTEHEDELMLLPVKNNVAPKQGGLTYKIVSATVAGNIETSRVEWTGETEIKADDAHSQQHASAPKMTEAMEFLEAQLAYGPKLQKHIEKASDRNGITWASVRRAKTQLEIKSHKDDFGGGWKWYTPEQYVLKTEQEKSK